MEEYLTTEELCDRIKYQKQTIYNLIHKKSLHSGQALLEANSQENPLQMVGDSELDW